MKAPPTKAVGIDLTFWHPSFERTADYSFLSGVYQLDLSIPVSDKLNIVAGIPFSVWSPDQGDTEQGFGNLFAGAQTQSSDTTGLRASATFGVALPTASEDESSNALLALFTNYHYTHLYIPNRVTIIANGTWYNRPLKGGFYGFEFGARIWIPTKSDDDVEMILNYGGNGGVALDPVAISLELVGQFLLSSEADSFSDKFFHTLSFGLEWTRGPFKPSLFYSLYLEEALTNYVNGVLGIRLRYDLE